MFLGDGLSERERSVGLNDKEVSVSWVEKVDGDDESSGKEEVA